MRGGWWRQFDSLGVVWSRKEKVFKVETSFSALALSCVVSWSSFHQCRDPRRAMTSSGRCSHVDVSSEFGGDAGLAGWRDWSVWIRMFSISFQGYKHRDVKESFVLPFLDATQ